MSLPQLDKDTFEWIGIDTLGIVFLSVDLDTTLLVVEIAVGVSLLVYNIVRIIQLGKKKDDRNN